MPGYIDDEAAQKLRAEPLSAKPGESPPSVRSLASAPRPLPPPAPPPRRAEAASTWVGVAPPPGAATLRGLPPPLSPPVAPISVPDADVQSWPGDRLAPPEQAPAAPAQRNPFATTKTSTPSPPSGRLPSSRPPPPPLTAIPRQPPIPAYPPVPAAAPDVAPRSAFVSPAQMIASPTPDVAVLAAYHAGRRVVIDKPRFVIGRNRNSCDLAIKDGKISRQHAMVEYVNGRYYIVDLGSTNGVEFRGQRVGRKPIYEGDVFRISVHEIRFSFR